MSVILKGIKPIVFILIFTSVINIFMTVGSGEPLFQLGFIRIYTEGIVRAIFMSLRVILLIVGTSLFLTYTTSPISLTDGMESLLSPLRKLGVPTHVFSMMMTIALRFIPTLIEETEKIMNAQKSRGADFTSGNLVKRARALIPLIVPLFASSFKRAEELAVAMECRCYRIDRNRTKLHKLSMGKIDYLALFLTALFFGGMILLKTLDFSDASSVLVQVLFYKI